MTSKNNLGQIIILNGTPRSGKSSIAAVIQETFNGPWINLGVDGYKRMTPKRYGPAIGLRPGGERPDLEPTITVLYAAMYDSIAAHSRLGVNVVVDVGHHDNYSEPRGILADAMRRLTGLPVLVVGVRCPLEVIINDGADSDPIPQPIQLWQTDVHCPGIYDLEVDTSQHTPEECAETIRKRLSDGPAPTANSQLAEVIPLRQDETVEPPSKNSERVQQIRQVMDRLEKDGAAVSRTDGKEHPVFPVAVSPKEATWLREWVRRERPVKTIEIGLGYGVSALHICEGLLLNGVHADKHVVIDPHQDWRFSQLGLQHLEDAGIRDRVEFLDEESQIALPRFMEQKRSFDFAFVDGNHHFDYVFLDLFYLGRLVTKGGLIVLDDYNWAGINKAVSFCVTNLNWVIEDTFGDFVALRTSTEPDERPGRYLAEF